MSSLDPRTRDALRNARIVVTGAHGFIGTHLCARLASHEIATQAVSRQVIPAGSGSVRHVRADLTDLPSVRRLLRESRPTVIFHLAGRAAGARDAGLVLPTFESNLVTTINLLIAAHELPDPPRIVLPASLEEPQAVDEPPSSPYAISKYAATAYARMFHRLYALPVAIGRLFLTYGPTERDTHKLIPYVIRSLLKGEPPRLGSGRRAVDWIYIDDALDGLLALATAPAAVGETLDIGSGSLVPVRSIVERLAKLIDPPASPHFDPALDRPLEQVRVADVARTRAAIGWEPRVDLDRGLAQTVAWFRARHAAQTFRPLQEAACQ